MKQKLQHNALNKGENENAEKVPLVVHPVNFCVSKR